jgi:heptosyltransferase-2/heptosyltransferase-3
MQENQIQKSFFHLTSVVTNYFPRAGAKFFDFTVLPVMGNPLLVRQVFQRNRKSLGRAPFRKILVIPDIHIGDAIMMQAAVQAFRDFFPEAQIDYVVKKSVAGLIEGNPAISRLYPLFTGALFPTDEDVENIKKLVAENHYDLCFNCSPFFEDSALFPEDQKILNFMTVAPQLMMNEKNETGINHFLFQAYEFVQKLLEANFNIRPFVSFAGVGITLSNEAFEKAQNFVLDNGVGKDKPIVFFNPDTASPYTFIPVPYQVDMLKKILTQDVSLLLGSGFTHQGIERQLWDSLSEEERQKVVIVPTSLPIDAYAALTDFADVFLSGDTGPLHIAAARKFSRSGQVQFKNKTFIGSIFGATPARMSGYDSENPLFPPAHQDAPSRTYISQSPCRNITCVNKMVKTCDTPRCFEVLDVDKIVRDVQHHLKTLKTPSVAHKNPRYALRDAN